MDVAGCLMNWAVGVHAHHPSALLFPSLSLAVTDGRQRRRRHGRSVCVLIVTWRVVSDAAERRLHGADCGWSVIQLEAVGRARRGGHVWESLVIIYLLLCFVDRQSSRSSLCFDSVCRASGLNRSPEDCVVLADLQPGSNRCSGIIIVHAGNDTKFCFVC